MKRKNHTRKPTSISNHNSTSKRRRNHDFDPEIDSDEFSDGGDDFFVDENGEQNEDEEEEDDELERETVEERRLRLAKEFVEKVKRSEQLEMEDDEDDDDDEREDKRGIRDSLVAKILQQEQLEDSGRARRFIASKLKYREGPELVIKHCQSVTSVALSDDDRRGFSASKDGCITHWDVETRKAEKYCWPTDEVLKSHGMKDPKRRDQGKKHSKSTLALAVSSDGRYLATGGLDRHVHLWDTRSREHIKAFAGHNGPVSCLVFRQGTLELFSTSFDRQIKIWNAEDRLYISTLFGHPSEVIGIDCLRKERPLTVGRDRTMMLWKVAEENHLIFRSSTSSLECCCFVGNDEFLTGCDDGSVELWNVLRKKPVSIVRNAHVISSFNDNRGMSNGHTEGSKPMEHPQCSTAQSWVGSVTVCRNSDLAASGAGNGYVRLWEINSERRALLPLLSVPLAGYVNSLAIAKSGRFLVAGLGQEPRLGRWDRNTTARNGVALQSFELTS